MRKYLSAIAAAGAIAGTALLAAPSGAETLKMGVRGLPPGQGNPYTGRGIPHVFIWTTFFDSLTLLGKGGVVEPDLADSWSVSADHLTWTFKLKPGIKFSNGEPLNAAAIKATFDWLMTEQGGTTVIGKNLAPVVASANVVDDLTVTITTKTPNPTTPREMVAVHIVEPKAWKDLGVEGFAKKPIGTGPYVLDYFKPGEAAVAARPDMANTYRPITGNVTRIEYFELPEGAAREAALLSGQTHVDNGIADDSIPNLKAAGMVIDTVFAGRTLGITLVSSKNGQPVDGPMSNVKVRQALNYAVNKQAIVDEIYGGNAVIASQAATNNAFGFNPNVKPYSYDPAKAKQLLAEAGYANGFEFEVQAVASNPQFTLVYQSAVQDLEAVGIKASLQAQPFADWLKHWLAGDWPYPAFGFGHDLSGNLDAGRSFTQYTSCMKNPPYYCNEDEMPLVKAQAEEFDVAKREALLQELLAKNAANAPIIFLTQGTESMAHSPKIKNFQQLNQVLNYEHMTIEK
jgi:peptide/nickel transport system substrate-binding protein